MKYPSYYPRRMTYFFMMGACLLIQESGASFNLTFGGVPSSQQSSSNDQTAGSQTTQSSSQQQSPSSGFSLNFGTAAPTQQQPTQPAVTTLQFGAPTPAAKNSTPSITSLIFGTQTALDPSLDYTFMNNLLTTQSASFNLSMSIANLLEFYQNASQVLNNSSTFSLSFGSSTTSGGVSVPKSPVQTPSFIGGLSIDLNDRATFSSFKNYMVGAAPSYLSIMNQMWALYVTEIQTLEKMGKTQEAQLLAQEPFQQNSYLLELYTQVVGELLGFIKTRINTFSIQTYGMQGAQYFLQTEVPACDGIVTQIQTIFNNHYTGKSKDGYPNVSSHKGAQIAGYRKNYQALQTSYQKQKGLIFAQFALSLFQSLSACYSPSLASNPSVTTLLGQSITSSDLTKTFNCLSEYYQQALQGLQILNTQTPAPAFGTYADPQAAMQQLSQWAGSLYVYAAMVGQNNISQACTTADALAYQSSVTLVQGVIPQNAFVTATQALVSQAQSYYEQAGQIFSNKLDVVQAQGYAQMSSMLKYGLAYWQKGDAFVMGNDFADAINAYQIAAQLFKKMGNVNLCYMLLRRADTATVTYYQLLLQSYTQYYQTIIPSFVQQMSTPPSGSMTAQEVSAWHTSYPNGFIQLFYYDPGTPAPANPPLCQGMSWLSAQAVSAFASLLNTYQTDTSDSGLATRTYLRTSLALLENLIQASQGMFYNDPLAVLQSLKKGKGAPGIPPKDMAANANIGSATVKGVVEGYLQYVHIYQSFQKMDAQEGMVPASTAQTSQTALPFAGLFEGLPLSGFADFSALSQLYWSLINVDPCLALVKEYPEYTQTVVSAALILLTYAKSLSNDPALLKTLASGYADWISKKITVIAGKTYGKNNQSAVDLLHAEGKKLQMGAQTALDYEAALACFMTAGLLGDTSAQQSYLEGIAAFAQWYKEKSALTFASFYAAMVYYRGYLVQEKGWKSKAFGEGIMKTFLQNELASFIQELNTFLVPQQSSQGYQETIAEQKLLATLLNEMQFVMVRQKREQLLWGIAGKDILNLTSTTAPAPSITQVSAVTSADSQPMLTCAFPLFPNLVIPSFVDPSYALAQAYYHEGITTFDQLQGEFTSGQYAVSLQDLYNTINRDFLNAITFFTRGGYQTMVENVQHAITKAAAFSYYSSVIPSNTVTAALRAHLSQSPTFSQRFYTLQAQKQQVKAASVSSANVLNLSFGEPESPVSDTFSAFSVLNFGDTVQQSLDLAPVPTATTASLMPEEQPSYLLRYFEKDLTLLAQEEAQINTATQACASLQKKAEAIAKAASAKAVVSLPTTYSYAGLAARATQLLGSKKMMQTTTSDTTLVTELIVPLYHLFLTNNAYSSPFSTIDQEVERYKKQVLNLVTGGMDVGLGARLFTSYTLEKSMLEGEEHLIIKIFNGPLQSVPRMQGEIETALFYYTKYSQFFALNPQSVQIGGEIFYQIADKEGEKLAQAFKGILGTYLAQMMQYQKVVKNCMTMAPPAGSLQSLMNYAFSSYQQGYGLVAQAYSWVLSSISAAQQAQQGSGIFWMSSETVNKMQFKVYQRYMQDCARFLVGSPLGIPYKDILEKIAGIGSVALGCISNAAEQQLILQALGNCYEAAGDVAVSCSQVVPSVDGYPSTGPTNIPTSAVQLGSGVSVVSSASTAVQCALPSSLGVQQPASYTLSWQQYTGGASYYLQAYKHYESAYTANPTGGANVLENDPNTRRGWGNYVLATARAIAQRLSLFGRNAITATVQSAKEVDFALNPQFVSIVQQGQTNGGQAALQGFNALEGGGLTQSSSGNVQAQYTLMKKLLLDAMIYSTALTTTTGGMLKLATITPSKKIPQDQVGGQAVQCGLSYCMPGITMVPGVKQNEGSAYVNPTASEAKGNVQNYVKPIAVWKVPSAMVSLVNLEKPALMQVMCANTFPLFVDYCLSYLMGTSSGMSDPNPFPNLMEQANMGALSDFSSQLYSMLQTAYMWSFLPPNIANNPSQLSADVTAAMKTEEQNMIVNPESYVG